MPLVTEIIRDDATLPVRWGQFHVAAMLVAIMFEQPDNKFDVKPSENLDYPTEPQPLGAGDIFSLVNYGVVSAVAPKGEYTLTEAHAFLDPFDNEVFRLLPGDNLKFWRENR